MCGIFAIFGSTETQAELRKKALQCSKMIRHRGPDWNGIHMADFEGKNHAICHERLGIVDPTSGQQPLFDASGDICVSVNGEIYNHMDLRELLDKEDVDSFASQSDCSVIPYLYKKYGKDLVHKLDGMWAFIVYDARDGSFFAARDPIGICPLYIGWAADGAVFLSSEMKSLNEHCVQFEIFKPGHYFQSSTNKMTRWYEPVWWNPEVVPKGALDLDKLRDSFIASVEKRMMADVPFGVLLSGGLDSSLVSAIAARKMKLESDSDDKLRTRKLHSFSIGLKGSPDLVAAEKVAAYLGTAHHSFTFDIEEGIDALEDVIYHLETYDVTTIRASTAMYLLSRKIKAMGFKMVLSGEGADEIFGGYLYFHKAPNAQAFHKECVEKIHGLHQFDVLRCNKSTMCWGLESRVPFLDKAFLDVAFALDPEEKMIKNGRIEKWCLRKAFEGYLPDEILWRQKEQFSDGVGYGWIDGLKDYAEKSITDTMLANAHFAFPDNTPHNKEAYLYRKIFSKFYPQHSATITVPGGPSVACSTAAAIAWDESFKNNADASGRAVLGVHVDGKEFQDAKRRKVEA